VDALTSNFLRNQPSNFEGATQRQTARQAVNITHRYVHIKPLQRKAFQHTRENSAQLNGISLAERHTKIILLLHPQYCNRMKNIWNAVSDIQQYCAKSTEYTPHNHDHSLLHRLYQHLIQTSNSGLTFRGPCIVIYSYNKTDEMH
jgi:predicted transcriptional regulator of viral defense system